MTLTYDEANWTPTLVHRHFQLFMKRLRKEMGPVRFYMCGEYGERGDRAHYHAALFGLDFDDKQPFRKSQTGDWLYTSETLQRIWGKGHCLIGAVTFESAAYIARYCTKKITGETAETHYERIDGDTGEVYQIEPEYNRMSLKPGIGKRWIEKYESDVYPHDRVVIRGTKYKPPRYYDKHLEERNEEELTRIKAMRKEKGKQTKQDNTPQRLKVQEEVTKAKMKLKRRTF